MMKSPDPGSGTPQGYQHSEAALGGADSVPSTPHAVSHGTDPNAPPEADRRSTARVTSGAGRPGLGYWIVGAIALAVLAVYGFGLFG